MAVPMSEADRHHMTAALALSRRNLGCTWPNPSVGCILVRDGRVVGRGVTAPGGRPHGEIVALGVAGENAKEATAYVTLEPCAHHRAEPSCSEALIRAGIRRVVAPMTDPDPRTSGRGIGRLRDAGIDVDVGLMAADAAELHAGFTARLEKGRPLVTLKVAATLDGRIATVTRDSKWITGPGARRAAHGLRFSHDAVLVGRGTARADNPILTCRLPGLEARSPVRIVADSDLGLSVHSALVLSAPERRTWIVCARGVDQARKATLAKSGVDIIEVTRNSDGRVDAPSMLRAFAEKGLTRLLVEGGATLATRLLREDLVDRIAWFSAPVVFGDDGLGALAELGVRRVADARHWRVLARRQWYRDEMIHLATRG